MRSGEPSREHPTEVAREWMLSDGIVNRNLERDGRKQRQRGCQQPECADPGKPPPVGTGVRKHSPVQGEIGTTAISRFAGGRPGLEAATPDTDDLWLRPQAVPRRDNPAR